MRRKHKKFRKMDRIYTLKFCVHTMEHVELQKGNLIECYIRMNYVAPYKYGINVNISFEFLEVCIKEFGIFETRINGIVIKIEKIC